MRQRRAGHAAAWTAVAAVALALVPFVACSPGSDESVTVQVVDGRLWIDFPNACPVAYLRLSPGAGRDGEPPDSAPWWEIRATRGPQVLEQLAVGATPPDGFEVLVDNSTVTDLPPVAYLSVKDDVLFGGPIDMAALADGDPRRVRLEPHVTDGVDPPRRRC